jgi:iron complex outermembrane receptor protein
MLSEHTRVRSGSSSFALAGIATAALIAAPAMAQSAPNVAKAANEPAEIIVTARNRQESIMRTPVVVQAITPEQIADAHVANIQAIATIAPGTFIDQQFALSGTVVYIRGIGNTGTIIDQSVGLNIDGFSSSTGALFNQGVFDPAQINVLKGPQSLFFGKSTSAGVIAITSADPTSSWEAGATVGYEFRADETNLSAFIAGPLTKNLGLRVAGFYNSSKGFMRDARPDAPSRRAPHAEDYGGRITLKYDDADNGLDIKLKGAFTKSRIDGGTQASLNQAVCNPLQTPPAAFPFDNCKLDNINQGFPPGMPYSAS